MYNIYKKRSRVDKNYVDPKMKRPSPSKGSVLRVSKTMFRPATPNQFFRFEN